MTYSTGMLISICISVSLGVRAHAEDICKECIQAPIQQLANHIAHNWELAEKDYSDNAHFEKRVSPSYHRHRMCARSVIETEVLSPPISDDDLLDSIRMYRIYSFPEDGECSLMHADYFYIDLEGMHEWSALDLATDLRERRWGSLIGQTERLELIFDDSIDSRQRNCLLKGETTLSIRGLKISQSGGAITGGALLHSCSFEGKSVLVDFKQKPLSIIKFSTVLEALDVTTIGQEGK